MSDLPPGRTGSGSEPDGEVDPSEWLADQFAAQNADTDADADTETDTVTDTDTESDARPERTPPAETPVLINPLAAPPSAFVWGLKPSAVTEPVEATGVEAVSVEVAPAVLEPDEPETPAVVVIDPLDFALNGGPSPESEPPTVALPWETVSQFAPSTELLGAAEPWAQADSPDQTDSPAGRASGAPLTPQQKALFWAIGGVLAALILVVLFVLGTKLPELVGPAPVAAISKTRTPTPTPTPSATTPVTGPVSVGVHKWNELRGAECLSPFPSPWQEKFTVVDCAAPHAAQLVSRAAFPAPSADGYPGIPALQAQINLLCGSPSVINFAAAGAYNDVQVQAAYAVTDKEWASGYHDYFCFVSRTSGDPITGSIAATPAG